MEEMVWFIIGIISILLVFGIITSFFSKNNKDNEVLTMKNSLEALVMQSEKVCQMPIDTYLSIPVVFVRGTELESNNGSICLTFNGENFCKRTTCQNNLKNGTELNLTIAPFKSIEYQCFFLRTSTNIEFECKG